MQLEEQVDKSSWTRVMSAFYNELKNTVETEKLSNEFVR